VDDAVAVPSPTEIARKAGVEEMLVRRVLGGDSVLPKNRRRIEKALRELGHPYAPAPEKRVPPKPSVPSPSTVKDTDGIDTVIRRLAELTPERATEVLADLDPAFVRTVAARIVGRMDPDSRARIAHAARRMEAAYAPTTDDELHAYVRRETGLSIPRRSVCNGHHSPFQFVSDVYFERGNPDKLAVGNRGSGKTQDMGALHAVNVRTKKRYTSCTIGAVEPQALRAYGFFRDIVTQERWQGIVRGKITMGHTETTNGGRVEIVTGTLAGVNSPHPILAHWDEVELLRPGVFEEGLHMAQSKDGHRAMNVLTSSWKKPKGFVSERIDESEKAVREGVSPPYDVYRWCVFETTSPCEHDCSACPFSDVVKGLWEDGTPRTFESACKRGSPEPGTGKLKHTDGFVAVEDAVGRFRKMSRRVWESQQESRRPTMDGLVYDVWDEDRWGIDGWDPDPGLGVVTCGIDFGGNVPHACGWWQRLDVEVRHGGVLLPQGADVLFDEVYIAKVGNVPFGQEINRRNRAWRERYPDFVVEAYYADPAANSARDDLRNMHAFVPGEEGIPTLAMGRVDVEERIALVYERMVDGLVFADRRCENWYDEVSGYERNPNTGRPLKEDDHLMDSTGYRFWNVHARTRRGNRASGGPVGAARPRAVVMTERGRAWDPATLGVAERRSEMGYEVPLVASLSRPRPGSPFDS